MQYYEVISSNIENMGHDKKDDLLEITFKSGGVYWYQGFNEADLSELMNAESKGKHFHKHIKGKFPFMKVTHYVQNVEFDSIYFANARIVGKPGYLPLSFLCEKHGWDFMETWDLTRDRTFWYSRQNEEYKLAVEERIKQL